MWPFRKKTSPELRWARHVYVMLETASVIDQCRISMSVNLRNDLVESAPDAVRKLVD